jgi:hypothetical protein
MPLALRLLLPAAAAAATPAALSPLKMRPPGAYCGGTAGGNASGCGETTPIVWHGELVMVEHHSDFRVRRQHYPPAGTVGNDLVVGSVPGSAGVAFVSATVVNSTSGGDPTLWLFGTNDGAMDGGKPRTQVHTFWSSDPALSPTSWKTSKILQLPQNGTAPPGSYMVPWWTAFNTSPAKGKLGGKDTWVLAIELGSPSALIGQRFTSVFATCDDCASSGDLSSGWTVLDPHTHIYRKDRYSACPTLRWYEGFFYVITLYEGVANPKGPHCNSQSKPWGACLAEHIVRSRDLQHWEESPVGGNETIIMGLPDGDDLSGPDHKIIPGSLLDVHGIEAEKAYCHNETDDINRSDMDMVTLPNGHTYVVWGSGNQGVPTPAAGDPPEGMSVAGIVEGTEQQWVESYFEAR